VTGGVDQVEAVALPFRRYRGGDNGDAAFTFLGHPVGDGGAVIHIAKAVGFAGIKQNPLGRGCFTSVNMGNYADITVAFERIFGHRKINKKLRCGTAYMRKWEKARLASAILCVSSLRRIEAP